MSRVVWKQDSVIGVELRKGVWALAQMYKSPYLIFFRSFSTDGKWALKDLQGTPILFFCPVTRQFLQRANIVKQKIGPATKFTVPKLWIEGHPGSRTVVAWPGTRNAVEFLSLDEKPGGRPVEIDIEKGGFGEYPVKMKSIPRTDHKTIDGHELNVIWTYPLLNERLYLCHLLNKNVDPLKDIQFDRSLPLEYKPFVEIMAARANLAALGYKAGKHKTA